MSVNTTQGGARPPSPLATFNGYLLQPATQGYLTKVLGDRRGEFVSNVVALVAASPQLQKCDPATVMFAAVKATALRLPLDPALGFAFVVPYGNSAQFQIGWRGLVQLALRTNQYRTINVRDVREGEVAGEDFVSGEILFTPLPPETRPAAPVVGYVAFFELCNGFRKMEYWPVADVKAHAAKFSRTFANGGGVWASNFDAMAKKTALKLLLGRYGPMSVDMQAALAADQAAISEAGAFEYVDNRAAPPPAAAFEGEEPPPPAASMAGRVIAASLAAKGKTIESNQKKQDND